MEDKNLKVCSLLFLSNFQENWCQDNNSSQCSTTQLSLRFQVAVQTTLRHCLCLFCLFSSGSYISPGSQVQSSWVDNPVLLIYIN